MKYKIEYWEEINYTVVKIVEAKNEEEAKNKVCVEEGKEITRYKNETTDMGIIKVEEIN